jgi:hypothetical protein
MRNTKGIQSCPPHLDLSAASIFNVAIVPRYKFSAACPYNRVKQSFNRIDSRYAVFSVQILHAYKRDPENEKLKEKNYFKLHI